MSFRGSFYLFLQSATFLGGEVRTASPHRQNQGMAGELMPRGWDKC